MNRPTKRTLASAPKSKVVTGINFEKTKTLSYTQLKEENGTLRQRNAELEQKYTKQSNAFNQSQRNAKSYEKENNSLREQLDEKQQQHADYVENANREWTSQKSMLVNKLSRCETKLEDLGVDPVSLSPCIGEDEEDKSKEEALIKAEFLKEQLRDNISNSENILHKIREISSETREALTQLDW